MLRNNVPKLVMLFLVAATLSAGGRADSSWDNLRRLKTGQKVEVVQTDFTSITGKFLSFSDESISLQAGHDQLTVPRANVQWITRRGGKRVRNALSGAAMLGGLAATLGAVDAATCKGWLCADSGVKEAVGLGAIGAIVGAVAGSFFGGHTTIYRAPEVRTSAGSSSFAGETARGWTEGRWPLTTRREDSDVPSP